MPNRRQFAIGGVVRKKSDITNFAPSAKILGKFEGILLGKHRCSITETDNFKFVMDQGIQFHGKCITFHGITFYFSSMS